MRGNGGRAWDRIALARSRIRCAALLASAVGLPACVDDAASRKALDGVRAAVERQVLLARLEDQTRKMKSFPHAPTEESDEAKREALRKQLEEAIAEEEEKHRRKGAPRAGSKALPR